MSAGDWKSLYQAVVDGDLARVRYHIAEGVNPNYQHPEILRSLLVTSLIEGHLDIAGHLLTHGADPCLVSEMDHLTPLQAARKHGHPAFAERLKQVGARDTPTPFWRRWLPL